VRLSRETFRKGSDVSEILTKSKGDEFVETFGRESHSTDQRNFRTTVSSS
jgi:hypothetical protein